MGARETDDFIAEERSDQSYFRSAGCSSSSPPLTLFTTPQSVFGLHYFSCGDI